MLPIYIHKMLREDECSVILTLAGSTSAGGCMQVYVDMVKSNMIDAIVATGASIVDMDFFEALGFRHYKGSPDADDRLLRNFTLTGFTTLILMRKNYRNVIMTIRKIADNMEPGALLFTGVYKGDGQISCG
jgi:deoxyhypusine synthase